MVVVVVVAVVVVVVVVVALVVVVAVVVVAVVDTEGKHDKTHILSCMCNSVIISLTKSTLQVGRRAKQHKIGHFQIDLQYVYFRPDGHHELYRQWVAMFSEKADVREAGVQGYLKFSLTVVVLMLSA